MKNKILYVVALAVLLFAILSLPACGNGGDGECVFVSNGDGTCYLSGIVGFYGERAVIPDSSPSGDIVIGVADGAFAGNALSSVTLPKTVKYIGNRAFANCKKLKEIELPANVEKIGGYLFEGCLGLETVTVSAENKNYFSSGNCIVALNDGLLVAGCKNSVIPNDGSVKAIGNGAFMGQAGIIDLELPNGLTSIGANAFDGCSAMTKADIPETVSDIGKYAFNRCSSLVSVSIPAGVRVISEGAFRYCSAVSELSISAGVEIIDDLAFFGCSSIVDPAIPVTVTEIGGMAFGECVKILNIFIPKNVRLVEEGAFLYCEQLWGLKVDKENPVYRASGNCLIRREDNVLLMGTRSCGIPNDDSVTVIADRAFYGCVQMRHAVIPSNIRYIGENAFFGCTYLEDLTVSEGVVSVGENAFSECITLNSVYIASTVTEIGENAFKDCNSLIEIKCGADSLPEGWAESWMPKWCVAIWGSMPAEENG